MMAEQKKWIDANAEYRMVSQPPGGGFYFDKIVFLTPDGETMPVPVPRAATYKAPPEGSFKVGVLAQRRVGNVNGF